MTSSEQFVDLDTEYGPIKGCKKMSVLGRDYFNFQRIPYMQAPVGKLRFRDPQPPKSWTQPLDCTQQGPAFCNVNFLSGEYEGDLDAMFLNLYTNDIAPSKPFPVMVWIHGGGIFTGNARTEMYSPDYMMQKDVVLVTFQYRIGVFGFLSLDDPSLNIPGNAQFRDHIFALKWIQRNVSRFGGDPNNVTLFGESWGGGSTSYHMLSPQSKGLFHKGILMSGTALNPLYSILPRREWAWKLCLQLGYNGSKNDLDMLEFLEAANEKELVLASPKILTASEKADENFVAPFGPTIEPYSNGNIFISEEIVKMAKNSWGNEINILIGATSNECSSLGLMAKMDEELQKMINYKRYVPYELGLGVDNEERIEYGKRLMRNYYGLLKPTKTNLEGLMHTMNDNSLWHPISRLVKSRENSEKDGKSYVYRFDIDSDNNLMKKFMNIEKYREPCHGDDVCYIFRTPAFGPAPAIESAGFEGIKLMLSVFVNYALTGNPNVAELGEGVDWKPATFDKTLSGVNINETQCEIVDFPEAERVKIFDELFIEQKKDLF